MHIAIVEDQQDLRDMYAIGLQIQGYQVTAWPGAVEAARHLLEWKLNGQPLPDVIVTDLNLGSGIDGATLIERLRQEIAPHETKFILMSGSSGAEQRLKEQHLFDVPFFRKDGLTAFVLERKIASLFAAGDPEETSPATMVVPTPPLSPPPAIPALARPPHLSAIKVPVPTVKKAHSGKNA